jgi:hypothetical protein
MATEAQTQANRMNAQRSTGPRTAAGKAVVAQNAVQHGLLGEQVVVEGEDRARYARHRDAMLRALGPIEEVEVTLAERLIGLSWRLQRVQRLQVQAFEALCAGPGAGPAEEGSDEELALGRIVVKDFSEGRVLDRLLMYERRLEHSLCRILGELRRERLFHNVEARTMDEGQPQVLLERLMGKLRDSPTATLRAERGCARYEDTPARDSRAETAEELWEQVSSGEREVCQGSPALETSSLTLAVPEAAPAGGAGLPRAIARIEEPFPGSGFSEPTPDPWTPAPDEACETNPISETEAVRSVLVRAYPDTVSPSAALSGQALPVRVADSHGQDARATHGRDAHATRTPADESCETNPIWPDAKEGQVLEEKGVTSNSVPPGLEKTNPILAEDGACPCLVEPVGVGEALAAGSVR